jgi:hypothetical protein
MRQAYVLPLLVLAGCYRYQPLEGPRPDAGSAVQLDLTAEGTRRLAADVGPDVVVLHGKLLQVDSSALDLSVTSVQNSRQEPTMWNGEELKVPRSYVQRIEVRRLSPGGTGLLGGVVAASLVAAYQLLGGQSTAQGSVGVPAGGSN